MSDDFRIFTGPIRPGATPVHVYNDGLTVFLFDASGLEKIRRADPKVIWYVSPEILEDPATVALLDSGELMLYGLKGDGGVDLEVVVGAPIDTDELQGACWEPPQRGRLALPTGQLCVHSYNTLPLGDNGDEPEDEGAIVQIPPGEYIVTIHRKDWDRMEDEGLADFDAAEAAGIEVYDGGRVDDVLVFTPVDEAEPLVTPRGILFPDCLGL